MTKDAIRHIVPYQLSWASVLLYQRLLAACQTNLPTTATATDWMLRVYQDCMSQASMRLCTVASEYTVRLIGKTFVRSGCIGVPIVEASEALGSNKYL